MLLGRKTTNKHLQFSQFSAALWHLPNFKPVHSLMLSSHCFLWLPCFLPPFTVSFKIILVRSGLCSTTSRKLQIWLVASKIAASIACSHLQLQEQLWLAEILGHFEIGMVHFPSCSKSTMSNSQLWGRPWTKMSRKDIVGTSESRLWGFPWTRAKWMGNMAILLLVCCFTP